MFFFFYRENTPEKQSTEQVSGYFILLWCGWDFLSTALIKIFIQTLQLFQMDAQGSVDPTKKKQKKQKKKPLIVPAA